MAAMQGGTVVNADGQEVADVLIKGGSIQHVGPGLKVSAAADAAAAAALHRCLQHRRRSIDSLEMVNLIIAAAFLHEPQVCLQ